jgi:glycosyltransferase involved in cell wall biosynthesis
VSTVDIVVPCYNYAGYLPRAVESALAQEGVDVRVLILDDCSPDNTAEVAERLAAADPRVTYSKNPKNLNLVGTANRGLFEWATGDYVVLLSADDALHPGALAHATRLMDANPNVGMVYGQALVFSNEQEDERAADVAEPQQTIINGEHFLRLCCEYGNPVSAAAVVVRNKIQRQVGPYNPAFPHTSDYEMWMRCALVSDVAFVRATIGYYRWHGSNMSGAHYVDMRSDLNERLRTVRSVLDGAATLGQDKREALMTAARRRCGELALQSAAGLYEDGSPELMNACIAYARDHGVSVLGSRTWWKLQAKRAMGRRMISKLRSARPDIRERKFLGFCPETL